MTRPILFQLYDHHNSGKLDLIGGFEFSLQKITEEGQKVFEMIDSKKKKKIPGQINVSNIQITKVYSFLDYISGGCQINLLIAVDFTGSNGHPSSPTSLHYINPNGFNQYQSALFAVSEILLNYDSDKQVPLYGFGGKINRQLSHCFPLTFDSTNPAVNGLHGIMNAYRYALSVVELSGPTLFAQVISTAVQMAVQAQVNQLNQQYFILLILTDGEIHDMRETIDWIVRGSNSPLSLVIVGIGNENFSNMDVLDADDEPLIDSHGKKMARDIVQFVPYKSFGNSPKALAKEVLAEIPREIVNFFRQKGIYPNQPIQAPKYEFERSYTVGSEDPNIINDYSQGKYDNPNPNHGSFNYPKAQSNPVDYYSYSAPKQ